MKQLWEIFWRFLVLGCTSFGGPAAHVAYFRKAFVEREGWLDDESYSRLIALSQLLPGPASSQTGFAIGLRRRGIAGGCAAFLGFTLPSFVLMYFLSVGSAEIADKPLFAAIVHGLKLLAVVVVADACLGMAERFCTTTRDTALMLICAVVILLFPGLYIQLGVLAAIAVFGAVALPSKANTAALRLRPGKLSLGVFIILLLGLPWLNSQLPLLALFSDFYQTGALVFGGGHVVLPLLQESVGQSVSTDRFLLGYAGAQAVPGPMFSLSAFLGAELGTSMPLGSALTACLAIFLPGFLLVIAFEQSWQQLASHPRVANISRCLNAAVVGLLLAALYNPVFVSAVMSAGDMAWVLVGLFLLRRLKWPVLLIVALFVIGGILSYYLNA